MTKPLIVVGAGGFGREVVAQAAEPWNPIGFLDDDERLRGTTILGELRVLGSLSDAPRHEDAWFFVAVGSPRTRHAIVTRLNQLGDFRYATIVSPSAGCCERSRIGEGSFVGWCCGVSDNTTVGRHCIINGLSSIGHDCTMGNFCTLAGHVGASGNVSIGEGSELGTGAVVTPGISIGRGSLCCAGSIVVNDVAENAVVAGNPARRFKDLPPFPA